MASQVNLSRPCHIYQTVLHSLQITQIQLCTILRGTVHHGYAGVGAWVCHTPNSAEVIGIFLASR